MFGHLGRNLAPGGAGDSNPGPLGTKSRVLDHSAPRGHSPGGSAPRGIIPLGDHPPGESSPWGIVPMGGRLPRESPPGGSFPWGIIPQGNHFPWSVRNLSGPPGLAQPRHQSWPYGPIPAWYQLARRPIYNSSHFPWGWSFFNRNPLPN